MSGMLTRRRAGFSNEDEEDIISLGGTPPPAAAEEQQAAIEDQQEEDTTPAEPALDETSETDANNAKTSAGPELQSSHAEPENPPNEFKDDATSDAKPEGTAEEPPKVPHLTRDRLNNILETRSAEATLLAESVSCTQYRERKRTTC